MAVAVCVPDDSCADGACSTLSVSGAVDIDGTRLWTASIDFDVSETVLSGEVRVSALRYECQR